MILRTWRAMRRDGPSPALLAAEVPADAPLDTLPAVVLDTETTGLNVRRDRVVALAAVPVRGDRVDADRALDRLVRPGRAIPPAATAIHGITGAMVHDAPPLAAVAAELDILTRDAVVVGHHVAFDLAFLAADARRSGRPWTPPPALDTALLAAALEPRLAERDLADIARHLGVEPRARHTALGDALMTAAVYARLLPRLRARGVATLGAAQAFARHAAGLARHQQRAGWFRA